MKEVNLKTESKKIGEYHIDDMKRIFGKRISKAIFVSKTDNGRIYEGLIAKKMIKKCKWWKFWNRDICKAYKQYIGIVLVPFVIKNENAVAFGNDMILTKDIVNKYKINHTPK